MLSRSSASISRRFFSVLASPSPRDVVIVSAVRTPVGLFNGGLAALSATQLGAAVVKAAVARGGIKNEDVDEVIMGNVVSAGIGQAPARQSAKFAGLPDKTICTTINKVCSSGMKAVMSAAQTIALGQAEIIVAGGMESMTNIPYYITKARFGGYKYYLCHALAFIRQFKYGDGKLVCGMQHDGLWDPYNNHHMGLCAEKCSADYKLTREAQDAYAIESYKRAADAWKAGHFAAEVVPVEVPSGKDTKTISCDEEFSNVNISKIPTLKPSFKKDGVVTAANASTLNDGASAMLLMSRAKAASLGLKPLALIRSYADAEQAPIDFSTSPALALPKAFARAGISQSNVDLFEINEAFSAVALANMQILGISHQQINISGGAVALGHPIGSSGCRIMVTLLHNLIRTNKAIGAAGICNGGGGASAMILERM